MTDTQKQYYKEMLSRGRLIPLRIEDKLSGFITFFIGNFNPEKYIKKQQWTLIDDEYWGDICYIDQLFFYKGDIKNHGLQIWRELLNYIRQSFPKIKTIRWVRYKNGKVNVFYKNIRSG